MLAHAPWCDGGIKVAASADTPHHDRKTTTTMLQVIRHDVSIPCCNAMNRWFCALRKFHTPYAALRIMVLSDRILSLPKGTVGKCCLRPAQATATRPRYRKKSWKAWSVIGPLVMRRERRPHDHEPQAAYTRKPTIRAFSIAIGMVEFARMRRLAVILVRVCHRSRRCNRL